MRDSEIQNLVDHLQESIEILDKIVAAFEAKDNEVLQATPEAVSKAADVDVDLLVWSQREKEFIEGIKDLYYERKRSFENIAAFASGFKQVFSHPFKAEVAQTVEKIKRQKGEVDSKLVAKSLREISERIRILNQLVPKEGERKSPA